MSEIWKQVEQIFNGEQPVDRFMVFYHTQPKPVQRELKFQLMAALKELEAATA